jgi:hypothetical protein
LAKRLEAAGIVDGKTLAKADPAVLTAIPGVSASRAAAWQKTAAGNAPTASSDVPADQPDTTLVVFAVPSADAAPVKDAPVEAAKPKAEKKPAKGKKKDEKAKTKKAEKPAKAKKAEKSKKADTDAKKTGKTKKIASDKKKSADKGKAEKTKKTKAKSKKKAKAA